MTEGTVLTDGVLTAVVKRKYVYFTSKHGIHWGTMYNDDDGERRMKKAGFQEIEGGGK